MASVVVTPNSAEEVMDALFEEANTVRIDGGQAVRVSKVKLKHTAFLISLTKQIFQELKVEKGKPTISLEDPVVVMTIFEKFPDSLIQLIELLTDIKDAGELDAADAVAVIVKIIEVNKTFFIEKVAPLMARFTATQGTTDPQATAAS